MSFLAPLFLIGALAVALPIVFHLIRRTSRDKVPFSSLMFLQPTPPRVTRRSRLENIWLLLFRCLVLCLLALGFARPFIQKPMAADPQTGQGSRLVLLLDTSASMRRDDLWAQAVAKTKALLRKTSPLDQVAILAFDRSVRPLMNFAEWNSLGAGERAALAGGRIDEAKVGWSSTHLGLALIAAAEALEEASKQESESGPRRIILISDLQEGSRLEGLQGYEWPRGVELSLELVQSKRPSNAGLQWVLEREDSPNADLETGPRLRVANSADSRREQFQIAWTSGERAVGAAVNAYVPPGQSRIVQAPKAPAGFAAERLALSGDEQDFDNVLHFVPPKAERISVLFLGTDPENDTTQLLFYLKRAFQQTRRQIVEITARASAAQLLPTDLENAGLLILSDPLPQDFLGTLRRVLSEGKTGLLVMKTPGAAQTLAQLLNLGSLVAEEAPVSNYAMLGQIEFEHPLFLPFADPRFSDFTKVHFWKHRRLDAEKMAAARVLARFDDGDAALLQVPVGKGNLLILTSGWHPADSQMALSSKFVPLLYSMLEFSGGLKALALQYLVGDEVPLAGLPSGKTFRVRKPDGSEVERTGGDKFSQTDLPGLYSVVGAQPALRFAVNLAAEESRTAPLPVEELSRLGAPLKHEPLVSAKKLEEQRRHLHATELESRQKLWRWLLVAALAVLILETWLAGWITRRASAAPAAS